METTENKSEAEILKDLLDTRDPAAKWGGEYWKELRYVGNSLEGFDTVEVIEGEGRRWTRTNEVITKTPSGKFLMWNYEDGLTENVEDDYFDNLPVEVEKKTRTVEITEWIAI